jgi:hypothetical protein
MKEVRLFSAPLTEVGAVTTGATSAQARLAAREIKRRGTASTAASTRRVRT